jgi:hypothetical protein
MELLLLVLWALGLARHGNPSLDTHLQDAGNRFFGGLESGWASIKADWKADAERQRALRQNRKAIYHAQRLKQQKLKMVEQQMIRGRAGNANPERAREALRGRGGRANPLDQKWF